MFSWIGYWLPVIFVAAFLVVALSWMTHLMLRERRRSRDHWLPTTEDERIGSLTRRYVHGDLTLDEFETEIDRVLRGEPAYQLDPSLTNEPSAVWLPSDNHPHAPIDIHAWQSVDPVMTLYPMMSGTATLSDLQLDQFAAWVKERDRIEDAKMKKEKIDKLRGSEGWPT